VIAAANVNSDGVFFGNPQGFSGSTHPATGQYTVTLTSPPANPNNILPLIQLGGFVGGQNSYLITTPGTIDVFTFDATGVAADRIFGIVVLDLT
jgi:hypothetical protein